MKLFNKNKRFLEDNEMAIKKNQMGIKAITTSLHGSFDKNSWTFTDGLSQRVDRLDTLFNEYRLLEIERSIDGIMELLLREGLIKEQLAQQKPDFFYGDNPMVIVKKKKK